MANYKYTRHGEGYTYEAPGHFDCTLTRLHDAADVDGKLVAGLSRFAPGGGTNYVGVPLESIYYIIEGQMLYTDDTGKEILLTKGDSVHVAPNVTKSVLNTGKEDTLMLVILEAK